MYTNKNKWISNHSFIWIPFILPNFHRLISAHCCNPETRSQNVFSKSNFLYILSGLNIFRSMTMWIRQHNRNNFCYRTIHIIINNEGIFRNVTWTKNKSEGWITRIMTSIIFHLHYRPISSTFGERWFSMFMPNIPWKNYLDDPIRQKMT